MGLGFPFYAPSKLSLKIFPGEGSHISELFLALTPSPMFPIYLGMLEISQFLKIIVSFGPAQRSEVPHLVSPNISLMLEWIVGQASLGDRFLPSKT